MDEGLEVSEGLDADVWLRLNSKLWLAMCVGMVMCLYGG